MTLPVAALDLRAVPAPFALTTALHLLTFVLHLAAMGTLVGVLVSVLVARARGGAAAPSVGRTVRLLPVLMAATVTLGVAPLLFLQLAYGRVVYSASISCALFWIQVPLAAMAAYALLYAAARRAPEGRACGRLLLGALVGVVWVSLVYSSSFALAERPSAYASLYAAHPEGGAMNPDVATWLPRWAQTLALAVSIGAFVATLLARRDEALALPARRVLAAAAGAGAVAAALRWALDSHVAVHLGSFAGATWALGALLPLVAVPLLARGPVVAGAVLSLALVSAVVGRHLLRLEALRGAFDPAAPAVRPQWDLFALFVLFFVAAALAIAWMLRTWFRAKPAPDAGRAA